jgi:hypothetical protein
VLGEMLDEKELLIRMISDLSSENFIFLRDGANIPEPETAILTY